MEDVSLRKPGRKTNKIEAVKPKTTNAGKKEVIREVTGNPGNPGNPGKAIVEEYKVTMLDQLDAIIKSLLCFEIKGKLSWALVLSVCLTIAFAILLIVMTFFVDEYSSAILYVGIMAYISGVVSYFLIILRGRQLDMQKKKS